MSQIPIKFKTIVPIKAIKYKEYYYKYPWKISTGTRSLDSLLDGGLFPFKIYSLYGAAGCGKSQIAMQMVITGYITGSEYGRDKVVFIDTEGSFNTNRIFKIAKRFGIEGNEILKNTLYAEAYNYEALIRLLNNVLKIINDVILIIIDNIAVPIQLLKSKNPKIVSRAVRNMMSKMIEIIMNPVSILLTNRVYSTLKLSLNAYQPYGGITLTSFIDTEILLIKEYNNVVKAFDIWGENPPVYIKITDRGLMDL